MRTTNRITAFRIALFVAPIALGLLLSAVAPANTVCGKCTLQW